MTHMTEKLNNSSCTSNAVSQVSQHREMDLLCVYSQKRLKWIALGPDQAEYLHIHVLYFALCWGGSVAEWLVCWTQALKGPGSNRSRDAVG